MSQVRKAFFTFICLHCAKTSKEFCKGLAMRLRQGNTLHIHANVMLWKAYGYTYCIQFGRPGN